MLPIPSRYLRNIGRESRQEAEVERGLNLASGDNGGDGGGFYQQEKTLSSFIASRDFTYSSSIP